MEVSLTQVPAGIKVPWAYIEFDGTQALPQPSAVPLRLLVIGQKTSAGTAQVNKPVLYTGSNHNTLFGPGSQLAYMVQAAWAQYGFGEVWAMPLADPSGTAASRLYTVTAVAGATAAAGTIHLLIGGRQLSVAVTAVNTANEVRDAIVAAVQADTQMLVGATAGSAGQFTLTAKNLGASMNGVRVVPNYFPGQQFPPQWAIGELPISGGTGAPDFDAVVWPNLDETQYHVIAHPYRDGAILTSLNTELEARWSATQQLEAVAVTAAVDTLTNLLALGATVNSKHLVIAGTQGSPTPSFSLAAALGAQIAYQAGIDPARPLQTLTMVKCLAPTAALQLNNAERDQLLNGGIATFKAQPGQGVTIERVVTTYQTNVNGVEDIAFLDVETMLTLGLLRRETRAMILTKFPRHKLGDDSKAYGAGQAIVTPAILRAELVALYSAWETRALCEGTAAFAAALIVERNIQDPTRLDVLMRPDLINQLRIVGVQLQFLL